MVIIKLESEGGYLIRSGDTLGESAVHDKGVCSNMQELYSIAGRKQSKYADYWQYGNRGSSACHRHRISIGALPDLETMDVGMDAPLVVMAEGSAIARNMTSS